jgi:hypothetical protein
MAESEEIKFRKQASQCLDEARKARDPRDQEAWLSLAEDFVKLAAALEQARGTR